MQPPDRLRLMQDMMKEIEKKEHGPCGGYSIMYACMCDYHNTPYREEVAWVGGRALNRVNAETSQNSLYCTCEDIEGYREGEGWDRPTLENSNLFNTHNCKLK